MLAYNSFVFLRVNKMKQTVGSNDSTQNPQNSRGTSMRADEDLS